jgi:phosphoserine phosphatase
LPKISAYDLFTAEITTGKGKTVTIVFDFVSIFIPCESLELLLDRLVNHKFKLQKETRKITAAGIRREIPSRKSLRKRLAIASQTRDEVVAFGESTCRWLTPGIEELIESLLPLAKKLEMPRDHIQGIKLL